MIAKKTLIVVCIALLTLMLGLAATSSHLYNQAAPARAAEFLKFNIPAVTHGFQKSSRLPNGDLFLLPQPFTMAVSDAPEGAQVFPVNIENFGGDSESIGGLPTTEPQGFALSTRETKVKALSCAESIWDGNLSIGSTPGTEGDTVRLFLEDPDGGQGQEIALFTVHSGGVIISELHPHLMLFINDRYAVGQSHHKGEYLPFALGAGAAGSRTDLITLSWPMSFYSPLQGCFRVGVEISRGASTGTTSVVFTDIVVNRNQVPGDEKNFGVGLLGRLTGGYPTGLPCKAQCPFPDDIPNPPVPNPLPGVGGDGTGGDCNTICYRSPQFFRLNINSLPYGAVMVGGVNFNNPVSTTNKRLIAYVLAGGSTPLQILNQQWVAAQLNMLNAGGEGSPKMYYALEGTLKCYGLQFDPITLANGFVISPDTNLKDLYQQTRFCIRENRTSDMLTLAGMFSMLNGNNPLYTCHLNW